MKRARGQSASRGTRRPASVSAETRERLADAARELFVERGFEHVTVRDICRAAGANVAAVSYHFGDKLGLYREVAREAIEAIRASDAAMLPPADADANERLRHYVKMFLPRIARANEDKAWIGKLMTHEMASPTPIAPWIFSEAILPRLMYLRGIVAELLGADPDDARVAHCVTSIQGQCLFYRPDKFKSAVAPGWLPMSEDAIVAAAEHIVRFSLAGIAAVRPSR